MTKNTDKATAHGKPELPIQPDNWEYMSEIAQDKWMHDYASEQAQHSPLRQVTVAEYGTFFALKNGSNTLATSPIREPLDALAHAYNHAKALAEALRDVLDDKEGADDKADAALAAYESEVRK